MSVVEPVVAGGSAFAVFILTSLGAGAHDTLSPGPPVGVRLSAP